MGVTHDPTPPKATCDFCCPFPPSKAVVLQDVSCPQKTKDEGCLF